jgi:hypothetical protein
MSAVDRAEREGERFHPIANLLHSEVLAAASKVVDDHGCSRTLWDALHSLMDAYSAVERAQGLVFDHRVLELEYEHETGHSYYGPSLH